jgi:hypothetical protein
MKTFKQYLNEESPKHMSLQEMMSGDCNYFFKQVKKAGLLVRGVNGYGKAMGHFTLGESAYDALGFSYYKRSVRKDRKPMDTIRVLHDIIDDWFEEEMGMKARSQTLFCFGESAREAAKEYGDLAVIVPIGTFRYCWSPDVNDLYDGVIKKEMQTHSLKDNAISRIVNPNYIGSDGKPDIEKISEKMSSLNYTTNKLNDAVTSTSEIMVECDEYYVIPVADDQQLGIIKKAFVNL